MIFTERTIRVTGGASQINSPIVLYKGDKNIKIRFKIVDCPYTYSKNVDNVIEVSEASYAQLVIKTPNDGLPIFSDIAETESGYVTFTITGEMIDEAEEVGKYSFQVRLLDDERFSRITIPEVVDGIEVREPIAIEGVSATNEVDIAMVNYAVTTAATPEDTFDSQGNYNKTTWGAGDRITAAKLNKIEAGIDGVNKKVASGGTSSEGMTQEQLSQLSTAYQHSQSAHAPSNAEANVQADWNEADTTSDAYIKNKPTNLATIDDIPTVPTNVSEFTNDAHYASETFVNNKIAEAQLGGGSGTVDLSGYVTKETGNANQITFADGQTFQSKLDAGTLKGDKGDKGDTGERGSQGIQGPAGTNGQDGLTTAISVNGNTYTHIDGVITLPDYPSISGGTGGSNINDTTSSATTTYSSNKIESIKENLSSQINDIVNMLDNTITDTTIAFSDNNAHASNYLNIETYEGGQNQPMHPKVLYFADKWNGFKYWMSYTPLPNEDNENPCIAVSNDMVNWGVPDGLENPLAFKPSGGGYNSDSHLVYRGDTNTLECWYREIVQGANTETYYRRTSTDGVNWTPAEQTFQSTGSITANLSPAILYEDGKYKMWTFANSPTFHYYESTDGISWGEPRSITIAGGNWWHGDVIHTSKGYELLLYVNSGGVLYYTKSADNITFDTPIEILQPTGSEADWDGENLYRSSFIVQNGYYYVFYSGRNTGTPFEWHIGLTRGKNISELRGMTGVTETKLNIFEAINELYNLIKGTSNSNVPVNSISLNMSSLSLETGRTFQLIATIEPENATNKTITWESDNPEVATVENGLVTGVATGECTITAIASNNKTATCSITVQAAASGNDPIMENLICWLDGRDGSGNQTTWEDRTSYNNDMILNGFDFNSASGWTGTGLKFDGVNDYCIAATPNTINGYGTNNPDFITVCLNVTINAVNKSQQDLLDVCSGNKGRFLLLQDNNISYQSASLFKTGVIAEVGKTYDLVYTYRSNIHVTTDIQRTSIYVNGEMKYENKQDVHKKFPSEYFNFIVGSENGTTAFANMVVNSIKIYDGELTEEQIQHNYQYENSIDRG